MRWLDGLGLTKYARTFADNEIDFETLSELTDSDLEGLGIPFGPRRKLRKALALLTPPSPAQPGAIRTGSYPDGRAERRHLTILFCDLVGSTALAERLDPEDFREIIRSYQDTCAAVIARYEGYIARYVGDGLFAYFGFPHAHEDEAERAVRSALDIVKAVADLPAGQEHPLRVRIGVSSGIVVVGDIIGHAASQQQAAVGEAPNIAARLHDLAPPDSVLIAAGTRKLLGDQFEYEDLGPHKLKGISRDIRVWRVKGRRSVQSRFDAAHVDEMAALVGREPELELMLERWRRAATGEGQMLLLCGEPGIGKSRVVEALQKRLGDDDHVRILYQCAPYHVHAPLYPVISQLEFAAGISPDHGPNERAGRLESLLRKWPVPDSDTPWLKALLSIPVDPPLAATPEEQKQRTLGALLSMLQALAKRRPLLWVVEDAHWSDPTTRELIGLMSDRAANLKCLIVVTYRPEFTAPWIGLGHCTMLTLNRLGRDACAALIADLTAGRGVPGEVSGQIIAKTDGVPLFVEELTRTVLESGLLTEVDGRYALSGPLPPLAIPSTLQDSLMARLHNLPGVKETAQTASVIGREFTYALLEAVSPLSGPELDRSLQRLVESGIVYRHGAVPPRAGYVFKHTLVQDAAYESLLRSERQQLHARVASVLEERYPERTEVEPEILAHHYSRAKLPDKAVSYWILASQRALDRSANPEVIAYVDKGLGMIPDIDDSTTRQRQELNLQVLRGAACRAVKGFASSDAEQSFARARELCEKLGDTERLVDVLRGLYSCRYARGQLTTAGELAQRVIALGDQADDSGSRMLGHWMAGCIRFWQGEYLDARRHLEQASSLYDPTEQQVKTLALQIDPGVNALFHLGWTLWILGYPEQAIRTADRAIVTARELSQPFTLSMALFFACETHACVAHDARSAALLEELQELSGKYRFEYLSSCAAVLEGQALIARDENAAGLEKIQQAFSEFRGQEAGLGLPWAMSIAAAAYRQLAAHDEGLALVDRAFEIVERTGERHWEAELHRLKGELLLSAEGVGCAEAERCFRRAMELARRQRARSLELRAAMSLAGLHLRQGHEAPVRELSEAYGWFSEGGSSTDLQVARRLLQISVEGGRA